MVPAQGFEPWTLGLKGRCSARLSYAGTAPFCDGQPDRPRKATDHQRYLFAVRPKPLRSAALPRGAIRLQMALGQASSGPAVHPMSVAQRSASRRSDQMQSPFAPA
jgi:hypothetical protein